MTLSELRVLVFDCQATSANPSKGRLLEVGWAKARAGGSADEILTEMETHLLRWQSDEDIPRAVERVTGIAKDELTSPSAPGPDRVWKGLAETVQELAGNNHIPSCATIIHFSRFEEPYLRQLHARHGPDTPFPFDIICTHEIAKRLLPELPRRGLRAIAGYLGHSVPELRRSAHHLAATAHIWRAMVRLLADREGVHTREELANWLEVKEGSASSGRAYPMDCQARLALSGGPGVYRMRRSNGDLLYIGKASSIRRRVASYFQKRRHGERTLEMLSQAAHVEGTVTETALEAALLESDEIKRHSPHYNVQLRSRDRVLGFSSADFRQHSSEPDATCRIGPLPSRDRLVPLSMIAALVEEPSSDAFADGVEASALGIPPEVAPELDCFKCGFELFRQNRSDMLVREPLTLALTRLGSRLWHERLEAADGPTSEDEPDETRETDRGKRERVWTPEAVALSLENVVLRGAHLIRRARWLCLLSESSLAWETGEEKRLIVFESGAPTRRESLPAGRELPTPPGHRKRVGERQKSFDLMTYDRLSVVTTELRRIVARRANIELRLGPRSILRHENLTKALRWV